MKKILLLPMLLLFMISLAAYTNEYDNFKHGKEQVPPGENEVGEGNGTGKETPGNGKNILVVYFSQSGTTQRVAERIVELTGADTYRILATEPYLGDGYPDTDRIKDEAYNDKRPEVADLPENIDAYDTIFVGTPIWWHYPAMVICTFLDNYDFKGKTVIPFCTYGATTWMPQTIDKIKALTPDSKHLKEFGSSGSTSGVEQWLREIGVIE